MQTHTPPKTSFAFGIDAPVKWQHLLIVTIQPEIHTEKFNGVSSPWLLSFLVTSGFDNCLQPTAYYQCKHGNSGFPVENSDILHRCGDGKQKKCQKHVCSGHIRHYTNSELKDMIKQTMLEKTMLEEKREREKLQKSNFSWACIFKLSLERAWEKGMKTRQ